MSSESIVSEWPEALPAPLLGRTHRVNPRSAPVLMESGRIRNRPLFGTPMELIDVTWNFTEDQFDAFKTFFEVDLENGSKLFELVTPELTGDRLLERTVIRTLGFWEATYGMARSDNLFSITATLEITEESHSDVNVVDDSLLPDLEITYPHPVCKDEFVLSFRPKIKNRLYCIESAEASTGPWGYHVFVDVPADALDVIETTFNNDYEGLVWFRVISGNIHVTKGKRPEASLIKAPKLSINNTRDALAEPNWAAPAAELNFPRPFWKPTLPDDGTYIRAQSNPPHRLHPIPYAMSVVENRFFAPTEVYCMPRYRVEWRQGGLNPTEEGYNTTVTIEESDLDTTTTWTRDNSDPTVNTIMPKLDGFENNAAVNRPDFPYLIRARSFQGECRSPMTILMVDKRIGYHDYLTLYLEGESSGGSCDMTGNLVDGDLVESGASCLNVYGGYPGYLETRLAHAIEHGIVGAEGHGLGAILNVQEGQENTGQDYLGWGYNYVSLFVYRAVGASVNRHSLFNDFCSHAHTFLLLNNDDHLKFNGPEVKHTQALIGPSKCFPDAVVGNPNEGPADIQWLGPGRNSASMSAMMSLAITDFRFGLASPLQSPIGGVQYQFDNINETQYPAFLLPYGQGFDMWGHITRFDILLTVHDDTKFFGERLNYWYTYPTLNQHGSSGAFVGLPPQFRSAFYRPYCIWDENAVQTAWTTLTSGPPDYIPLGLPAQPAWGPIWDAESFIAPDGSFTRFPPDRTGNYDPAPVVDLGPKDTFDAYLPGDAESLPLDSGSGWNGNWSVISLVYASGFETFEIYAIAVIPDDDFPYVFPTDLVLYESGEGWSGSWVFLTSRYSSDKKDSFASYTVGNAQTQTLNGGPGWFGAWTVGGALSQNDGFETPYTIGNAQTQTLNGGPGWVGSWAVSGFIMGFDTFETPYTTGNAEAQNLNQGAAWSGSWNVTS